jgi:hypothetical protein
VEYNFTVFPSTLVMAPGNGASPLTTL